MIYVLYFTNILYLEEDKHFRPRILGSSDVAIKTIDEFKINPKELICQTPSNKSILFISFVIIAPQHFEKRDLIRSTWGNKSISSDFRIIFTIGMSENETINRQIEEEHRINEDILQINNFIDNYFNLTTKIMKSFKFISTYCPGAQYVLRINDDVMVNTFGLINYFKTLKLGENQIYGHLLKKTSPIRFQHKHMVSRIEYDRDFYPNYPEGKIFLIFSILTK